MLELRIVIGPERSLATRAGNCMSPSAGRWHDRKLELAVADYTVKANYF